MDKKDVGPEFPEERFAKWIREEDNRRSFAQLQPHQIARWGWTERGKEVADLRRLLVMQEEVHEEALKEKDAEIARLRSAIDQIQITVSRRMSNDASDDVKLQSVREIVAALSGEERGKGE